MSLVMERDRMEIESDFQESVRTGMRDALGLQDALGLRDAFDLHDARDRRNVPGMREVLSIQGALGFGSAKGLPQPEAWVPWLAYPLDAAGHGFRPALIFRISEAVRVESRMESWEESWEESREESRVESRAESREASRAESRDAASPDPAANSGEQMLRMRDLAIAVELLHNASLLHDDLLDGGTTRRGQPCLHRVRGDRMALLSGNIYYIQAFRTAVERLDAGVTRAMLDTALEMCEGELLQDAWNGRAMPRDIYLEILRRKTASLVCMACGEAARLAGAGEPLLGRVRQLGTCIGMLYQLRDDVADGDADVEPDVSPAVEMDAIRNQAIRLMGSMERPEAWSGLSQWLQD